jgi:hypothetical protein
MIHIFLIFDRCTAYYHYFFGLLTVNFCVPVIENKTKPKEFHRFISLCKEKMSRILSLLRCFFVLDIYVMSVVGVLYVFVFMFLYLALFEQCIYHLRVSFYLFHFPSLTIVYIKLEQLFMIISYLTNVVCVYYFYFQFLTQILYTTLTHHS